MDKSKLHVKLDDTENITKYIPLIRSYNKHSISEIKMNAKNKNPVMTCNYIEEPEEMSRLYSILKKLEREGANLEIEQELYGIKRIVNLSTIANLIERDEIISQQIQEYDDIILDED